ncbi:MAG: methyltransferase domain-containing protein [Thermodesulfobacteriota bacterium]
MKTLDIGCGNRKVQGAVGLDKNPRSQADIVHDLDVFPYPFEDNYFDRIYGIDVLEHVTDVIRTLEEIHRLGKKGARVFLRLPHFSSTHAFGDPTHKHFFNSQSLDYVCGGFSEYAYETSALFKKIKVRINFWKLHRLDGVSFLANRCPISYEKLFAFIFPAMNIEFELEVLKD